MLVSPYGTTHTPLDLSWATAYPLSFLEDVRLVPAPLVAPPPLEDVSAGPLHVEGPVASLWHSRGTSPAEKDRAALAADTAPLACAPAQALEPRRAHSAKAYFPAASEAAAVVAQSSREPPIEGGGSTKRARAAREGDDESARCASPPPRMGPSVAPTPASPPGAHDVARSPFRPPKRRGGRREREKKRLWQDRQYDVAQRWLAAQGEAPAQGRVSPPTRPSPASSSPDPLNDLNVLVFDIPTVASDSRRIATSVIEGATKRPRLSPRLRPVPSASLLSQQVSSQTAFEHAQLFPDLKPLQFCDYEPYLLHQPVEHQWSSPFYHRIIEFLLFCEPMKNWMSSSAELKVGAHPTALRITSLAPDKRTIQARFTPRRSDGYAALDEPMRKKFRAMLDVMRWLWDNPALDIDHVADIVRRAPLALHVLVREYASVPRCSELVQHREHALRAYLARLPCPTPHQRAALLLLHWLAQPAFPNRHFLFFCLSSGEPRLGAGGEAPWMWWFGRAMCAQGARMNELDDWERERLKEEGCGGV
ncbi:hypothetical protein JCM10450v2_005798 [Rhodotorula kratochvilovae]